MRMKTILIAAAGLALTVGAAHAQVQTDAALAPQVAMMAASIGPDGARQGSASGATDFVVGKTGTHYLFAGNVSRGQAVCGVGQARDGARPLETLVSEYEHVWQISTTAVAQEDGQFVFDLDWKRYGHATGTRPVAAMQQRLTLADGRRHVLDMLHAPPGAHCASVVVDLEVQLREDPARADEAIQYDLWLVHTDANGRKQTRRAVLTGLHGARVPFAFGALRFAAPKLAANQYDFDVVLRVLGDLRGRVGADGTVEVELLTRRRDTLERRAGESPGMFPGGTGRKVLSLKPGEAVEVEIPVAGGTMGSQVSEQAQPLSGTISASGGLRGSGAGTPPTEPFVLRGNSYVVNFKPFFEGHRVTLIVQARRQE